jgi:hypothetical protein
MATNDIITYVHMATHTSKTERGEGGGSSAEATATIQISVTR